jgi:phosphate/sulfate permease
VLTCTGVSFAHGSNDGQKGMGLIMLILIGTVPMAYALNHAVTPGRPWISRPCRSRPPTSCTATFRPTP